MPKSLKEFLTTFVQQHDRTDKAYSEYLSYDFIQIKFVEVVHGPLSRYLYFKPDNALTDVQKFHCLKAISDLLIVEVGEVDEDSVDEDVPNYLVKKSHIEKANKELNKYFFVDSDHEDAGDLLLRALIAEKITRGYLKLHQTSGIQYFKYLSGESQKTTWAELTEREKQDVIDGFLLFLEDDAFALDYSAWPRYRNKSKLLSFYFNIAYRANTPRSITNDTALESIRNYAILFDYIKRHVKKADGQKDIEYKFIYLKHDLSDKCLPGQFKPYFLREVQAHANQLGITARTVFDPCAGWGDRMVGAMMSGYESYTAYDPSSDVMQIHEAMRKSDIFLSVVRAVKPSNPALLPKIEMLEQKIQKFKFSFHHKPIENFSSAGPFDVAVTCPPYVGNRELYAFNNKKDKTQTWRRYPSAYAFNTQFLPLLLNTMNNVLFAGGLGVVVVSSEMLKPVQAVLLRNKEINAVTQDFYYSGVTPMREKGGDIVFRWRRGTQLEPIVVLSTTGKRMRESEGEGELKAKGTWQRFFPSGDKQEPRKKMRTSSVYTEGQIAEIESLGYLHIDHLIDEADNLKQLGFTAEVIVEWLKREDGFEQLNLVIHYLPCFLALMMQHKEIDFLLEADDAEKKILSLNELYQLVQARAIPLLELRNYLNEGINGFNQLGNRLETEARNSEGRAVRVKKYAFLFTLFAGKLPKMYPSSTQEEAMDIEVHSETTTPKAGWWQFFRSYLPSVVTNNVDAYFNRPASL